MDIAKELRVLAERQHRLSIESFELKKPDCRSGWEWLKYRQANYRCIAEANSNYKRGNKLLADLLGGRISKRSCSFPVPDPNLCDHSASVRRDRIPFATISHPYITPFTPEVVERDGTTARALNLRSWWNPSVGCRVYLTMESGAPEWQRLEGMLA